MIPDALVQCTVDLPSGLTVRPFADDPHITQEGFILHGSSAEIRAKVYRFLLQREISSNVAPSVREHLEWHPENGNQIQIFPFRSLAHLTLQAFPPPAKRRVSRKPAQWIFFHEYGRRVGMVPRSSWKERKYSRMVEKRTKTTQPQKTTANRSPKAESPPSCSLSSVLR